MPGGNSFETSGGFTDNDLLASTEGYVSDNEMILASTRDNSNDTPTNLRKGLVLAEVKSGPDAGKYAEFDPNASDGRQLSQDVVILFDDVYNIDEADGAKSVPVVKAGHVKEKELVNGANVDWSQCQRLVLRDGQ